MNTQTCVYTVFILPKSVLLRVWSADCYGSVRRGKVRTSILKTAICLSYILPNNKSVMYQKL